MNIEIIFLRIILIKLASLPELLELFFLVQMIEHEGIQIRISFTETL